MNQFCAQVGTPKSILVCIPSDAAIRPTFENCFVDASDNINWNQVFNPMGPHDWACARGNQRFEVVPVDAFGNPITAYIDPNIVTTLQFDPNFQASFTQLGQENPGAPRDPDRFYYFTGRLIQ